MYLFQCNYGICRYFCDYNQKTISLKFSFLLSCSIDFYTFFSIRKIKIPNNCLSLLHLLKLFLFGNVMVSSCGSVFIVGSSNKILINITFWYPIIVIENNHLKYIILSEPHEIYFPYIIGKEIEEQGSFGHSTGVELQLRILLLFSLLLYGQWKNLSLLHLRLSLIFFPTFSPTKIITKFLQNCFFQRTL